MLVTYIRSSSYNNYDFCQQQYFINYVLGHPTISGKKAEMGTIVHKAMEGLGHAKKALQDKKKSFKDEVLGRIRVTKDKILSDNFVNSLYDKSFKHYTAQSPHTFQKKDYEDCKKWVWMGLEYNEGQFDPRHRKIIDTEPHFDIVIDEPWAKYNYKFPDGSQLEGQLAIKGTIDLITEISGDPTVAIEAIDWKTGRRIDWATGQDKDYAKLQKDPQLLLYYYAISKMYPEYKDAIMTIYYIKDGGPFSFCFGESEEELFLKMLRKRFNEIKNNQVPTLISPDQSNWKCTKLCTYYKNNWQGTNINMCKYIQDKIKKDGMANTIQDCTKEGFTIGYYNAPG